MIKKHDNPLHDLLTERRLVPLATLPFAIVGCGVLTNPAPSLFTGSLANA
jgi:hypothetical protein